MNKDTKEFLTILSIILFLFWLSFSFTASYIKVIFTPEFTEDKKPIKEVTGYQCNSKDRYPLEYILYTNMFCKL